MKKHEGYQPKGKVNTSNPPKGEFYGKMSAAEKILTQVLLEKHTPIEAINSISFSHHKYPFDVIERCVEITLNTKNFYCAGEKETICLLQCSQCKKDQKKAAKIQGK